MKMLIFAVALPLAGQMATFGDYKSERPGVWHKIRPADLPAPYATKAVDNGPREVARPAGALPQVKAGFEVTMYAAGLNGPRLTRVAPNGDVFVVESEAGNIRVLRGGGATGRAETVATYATGLSQPFGIAFYPVTGKAEWLYVANTDSVVRFAYRDGDLKARGAAQLILNQVPSGGRLRGGGHWTRDIAFSKDGKRMFVSVGSLSNVDDTDNNPAENDRAAILVAAPDGSQRRVFAKGIRNPVGLAVDPATGLLWTSVNERDGLGDNLVPDYITHVEEGGFYGWPWFYMGGNQDPRHKGKHPELQKKVIVPDVLLQPHHASLQLTFYDGKQFPAEYAGQIFAAQHGSWNRSMRTGYSVVRVQVRDGKATGAYEDFMTGFVLPDGNVWGRPVGVAVSQDGALLVSDDVSGTIWRVSYTGR